MSGTLSAFGDGLASMGWLYNPPSRQVHLTSPSQVVLPGYNQASHRATKSVVSKNVPADVRPMRSERRKVGRDRTEYYKQYYLNNPAYFREHGRKQQQEIKKYIQQQKVGLSCKRWSLAVSHQKRLPARGVPLRWPFIPVAP